MPLVQEIRYAADEAPLARRTVDQARAVTPSGTLPVVRTYGAGAVWRLMHALDDGVGFLVRLEPVDPHDVPIGQAVLEMPLARPTTLM